MSNRLAPSRASTSSTARAPAMPFPTTTSFFLDMAFPSSSMSDLQETDVHHEVARGARGCGEQHFELGFGNEVFDNGEWHVLARPCTDWEVAHRFSVAHEREIDELLGRIAGAQVDELCALVGRHGVEQL